MQAGFGGFEYELLKKLHYEFWNAEIHKIRSRFIDKPWNFLIAWISLFFWNLEAQMHKDHLIPKLIMINHD